MTVLPPEAILRDHPGKVGLHNAAAVCQVRNGEHFNCLYTIATTVLFRAQLKIGKMKFGYLPSLECSSVDRVLSHPPLTPIFTCKAGLGPVTSTSTKPTEALQPESYLI